MTDESIANPETQARVLDFFGCRKGGVVPPGMRRVVSDIVKKNADSLNESILEHEKKNVPEEPVATSKKRKPKHK